MLKETEEESGSEEEDAELVSLLDSAADLRAQPADGAKQSGWGVPISASQTPDKPVQELMPSPCMPSPAKAEITHRPVTPSPTSDATPRKKKRSMAWVCCKASPTKPDIETPAGRVPHERDQAVPSERERLPNGDSYRGQYGDGVRQGHAVYSFANGDVYEGQFGQDCMQGSGVYTFANEGKYTGQVMLEISICILSGALLQLFTTFLEMNPSFVPTHIDIILYLRHTACCCQVMAGSGIGCLHVGVH